jgi:hypothetical protein
VAGRLEAPEKLPSNGADAMFVLRPDQLAPARHARGGTDPATFHPAGIRGSKPLWRVQIDGRQLWVESEDVSEKNAIRITSVVDPVFPAYNLSDGKLLGCILGARDVGGSD